MGFLHHSGMWGDFFIMSIVVGLVFPYLVRSKAVVLSSLCIALTVTVLAHILWAKGGPSTGHMFPTHETGKWYLDISVAGWMHVLVMGALFTVMLIYAVSPLPTKSVVAVSILVTAHLFLGMVPAVWVSTGETWTWRSFGPPVLVAGLVWGIAMLKIQFATGSLWRALPTDL